MEPASERPALSTYLPHDDHEDHTSVPRLSRLARSAWLQGCDEGEEDDYDDRPEQLDRSEKDPMRFHLHYHHAKRTNGGSPYAGGSSFMERVSEGVASGMGTVSFLVSSSAIILGWVLTNHGIAFLANSWRGLLHGNGFDPAPFILLNLVFSAVAFYTGALVIIAQKAQTRTDRANEEATAKHREELAQFQMNLLQRNTDVTDQIHALTEQLRALTEQVHAATCGRFSP